MKRYLTIIFAALLLHSSVFAQNESPYKTSLKVDGPIILGSLAAGYWGVKMIQNKDALTDAELAAKSSSDINGFDRFAAGNYSEQADKDSYIPFYASFAAPIAMLLNKNESKKAGQVLVLFTETMAITGAMFSITAGSVQKSRPYVYSTEAPLEKRKEGDAQRSFYAGHTAASASATFFLAKVYQDFNPDSRAIPYVWAGAAAVPAVVGYLRLKGGNHFLTDNIIGYAVGAGVGILVPELHKKGANTNLSLSPTQIYDTQGVRLAYTF